jgi:hypothetical protein
MEPFVPGQRWTLAIPTVLGGDRCRRSLTAS